ncbi:membrane protein [Runella zeae]|uniref:membrane protein n=1 Tax=Runella zeae TaxID=94255 RepID=UPI000417EA31|nr:membrane protein [Runella zeae]
MIYRIDHTKFLVKNLTRNSRSLLWLKKGIWLYFILLIFEGALRKWVFPSLATPLLIVRDPVALFILVVAIKHKYFVFNSYLIIAWVTTFLSFCFALWVGHGNITVGLFGARIMFLHFPLIFLIGKVFTWNDVHKIGKTILWITLPMTILIAFQFYSPQSAWVNRGIGGDITGGGFSGALGYFRPPGTFSFISGVVSFYGLLTSYIYYYWLSSSQKVNKVLLMVCTGCLLATIPLSISRSLLGGVIVSTIFALMMLMKRPKTIFRLVASGVVIIILLFVLTYIPIFQTGIDAFTARFESANEAEGGAKGVLIDRFLGGMYNAIIYSDDLPLLGYGIGMGTNVGAKLITGKTTFLIAEGEWGRLIGEMGIVFGVIIILLRVTLAKNIALRAFRVIKSNNFLPWMLLSCSFLNLIQGQWAQPNSLGFTIMSVGLTMAAFKGTKMNR